MATPIRPSQERLHRHERAGRPSGGVATGGDCCQYGQASSVGAFSSLYRALDGRKAYNPTAGIERPAEPKPSANAVSLEAVVKVLTALEARAARHNRGWKTLARCRVIALTGMRHSQVGRLKREDIWLDHDPPLVIVSQPGKDGNPHWKPLIAEAVEAFHLFMDRDAFGEFSASSVYKSWKLACEEAGCRSSTPTDCDTPMRRPFEPEEWISPTCRSLSVTRAPRLRHGTRWCPHRNS